MEDRFFCGKHNLFRRRGGCFHRIFFFPSVILVAYHTLAEPFVHSFTFEALLGAAILTSLGATAVASPFPTSGPTVPGSVARIRYGRAHAPEKAPLAVKRAIWAGNQLRSKRYRFGGGHRSFNDSAYDCSGTISYVLGGAGLLKSPTNSAGLRGFGQRGRGKWITIYARKGHTFAVIAGLRIDTTPWDESTDRRRWAPRWQTTDRKPNGFEARHPVGL